MLKVKFRAVMPQKSNSYRNDYIYSMRVSVGEYIKNKFGIRNPKTEPKSHCGYDDEKGEYAEIWWLVEDKKPIVQEKIIWLNWTVDRVNMNKRHKRSYWLSHQNPPKKKGQVNWK